jgi:hypothetical protein
MVPILAVLAFAGVAAVSSRPATSPVRAESAHTVSVRRTQVDKSVAAAEKDLARRQAELGLVGAAPLFGAEGLPKPRARR